MTGRETNTDTPLFVRLVRQVMSLAVLWPICASANHDAVPDPVPTTVSQKLQAMPMLRREGITVSGLSSGGFFAHQFHVAHSSLVRGAGIVAGGPYGCVENIADPYWALVGFSQTLDRLSAAVVGCSHILGSRYWGLRTAEPKPADSIRLIREDFTRGTIDDPANLSDARVWIFHGSKDDLVPSPTTRAVADVYRALGTTAVVSVLDKREPAAEHGMPVAHYPEASPFPARRCDELKPPFIIECGFDAAESILRHLLPDDFKPASDDPHRDGSLAAFDQGEFFERSDRTISLAGVGFLYVPTGCNAAPCRLHVAFHGCLQNAELVHDDWVRDAGYNRWAATNGVVVLYPQTTQSTGNLSRCWDFWGYSGASYRDRNAPQIRAVKAMVDRLLGPAR